MNVTFGLQVHHIQAIEAELKRWRDKESLESGEIPNPLYIKYVWEKLGRELGWCPFTLALYYFEHLETVAHDRILDT